jgi:predicted Zn-dependent protease
MTRPYVLSRDDALAIGNAVLGLIRDRNSQWAGVRIEQKIRAVTKITDGRLLNTDDGEEVRITFKSRFGVGMDVVVGTNQLDDSTFQRVLEAANAMAPPSAKPAVEDLDDQYHATYRARAFPDAQLWHDTTLRAMETERSDVIPRVVEQLRRSGLKGSATVGCATRSVLYLYPVGLTAFARETDSEITVTARTPDDSVSGWSGQANRDWTQLSPDTVIEQAATLANLGRNRMAFEPGRRTAILGPAAVAQLVCTMAYAFSGKANESAQGRFPFSVPNEDADGRHVKLGMRVMDPRIKLVSDPNDPLGGYPPFFEAGGLEGLAHGFPTPGVTWIDQGVLHRLAYDVYNGSRRDLSPCDLPESVRLCAVPGIQMATIDEMIADCQEGIYVNRFSDVSLLDRPTGMMTGVTRDGCFLIRNGKIDKAVKNFRFVDSPFFMLNKLEHIGVAERVAFGYQTVPTLKDRYDTWLRWPALPVIVPPLMVRDFNFTGISDAV